MNNKVAAAYQQGGLEAQVRGASSHQLILLLMDGILVAIARARLEIKNDRIEERGVAISKAVAIFMEGLSGVLDFQQGGEVAENLDALYHYCCKRLLEAHQYGDVERLDEVERLFRPIRDAWFEIGSIGRDRQEISGAMASGA